MQQLLAQGGMRCQGFQSLRLLVLDSGLPGLQIGFAAGQKLIALAGQRRGSDTRLAREQFDIFPRKSRRIAVVLRFTDQRPLSIKATANLAPLATAAFTRSLQACVC